MQHYFTVNFSHENQKALELRTEDAKDCDEWVAAIAHARYIPCPTVQAAEMEPRARCSKPTPLEEGVWWKRQVGMEAWRGLPQSPGARGRFPGCHREGEAVRSGVASPRLAPVFLSGKLSAICLGDGFYGHSVHKRTQPTARPQNQSRVPSGPRFSPHETEILVSLRALTQEWGPCSMGPFLRETCQSLAEKQGRSVSCRGWRL